MTRRKSPSLMNVDPVEVMFRAMRISEAVAAREQQRGDNANLKIMNDAMLQAASLARDIAAIQDRRGTAPSEPTPKVNIKITDSVLHCPRCGYEGSDLKPLPQGPPQPRRGPAATIDLTATPSSTEPAPATGAKAAPTPAPVIEPPKLSYAPSRTFGPPDDLRPSHGETEWL